MLRSVVASAAAGLRRGAAERVGPGVVPRPVAVEELLGRDPVELDTASLHELLHGRVVLVTGAGGSIGSELARQAGRFAPRLLVLVERAEPALWRVERELRAALPATTVVGVISDVTDELGMRRCIAQVRPDVVLHAAAHKHVPMMEAHPGEAVRNNVGGTRVVVDLAAAFDVGHLVLVSTDKAVNPSSVMGATKRVAERYVQHVAARASGSFVAVRFGNVLGSAGSVVPIFEEQLRQGGPLTVTHPAMERYFMTIPEASGLVLQAAAFGRTGEVMALDMGDPVRIVDLARDLIRLAGLVPGRDVDIVFTGRRPGEKLAEELVRPCEQRQRTRHPKVWVGRSPAPDWPSADAELAALLEVAATGTGAEVRAGLRRLVPEYAPARDADAAPLLVPLHEAEDRVRAATAAVDRRRDVGGAGHALDGPGSAAR